MRTVRAEGPTETGRHDGLAWVRFAPDPAVVTPLRVGVVVLHGAASSKDSHHDYLRVCAAAGIDALAFDARGHGGSDGPFDGRALDDVARMADLLRVRAGVTDIALRGASMGGYFALAAALEARAGAVVSICPASATGLSVGIRARYFPFESDRDSAVRLLAEHDEFAAIRALEAAGTPTMLLHAEGDEVVPVEHTRELAAAAPSAQVVVVPGGHHRSVAHDAELQAVTIRFLQRSLRRS
ncbi:alpha/beta hydrolase family protein [Conexibacter woesei]|uniref:alpha/beta hydrolase family protein n=1 Tax=Conexibacter woesei TaxID=191495 RepID=UPI00041C322E|nr:alpha/beta fold hydrolase [Conexibacter woesei]